jgi:hypothetical protein
MRVLILKSLKNLGDLAIATAIKWISTVSDGRFVTHFWDWVAAGSGLEILLYWRYS